MSLPIMLQVYRKPLAYFTKKSKNTDTVDLVKMFTITSELPMHDLQVFRQSTK